MGKKPQPSNKPVPDFLVKKDRGINPRGVPYDREINDQMESLKSVGQFAWESLPGIGTAYTIQDIKDELAKEEPNYYMIGALAGAEVIGLIPGLGDAAAELIKKGAKSAGKLGSKIDRAIDQTTALLGRPKVNPELEIFGGARASNPPNMTGYGSIDSTFNAEADFKTLENLSVDFENDPTGSLVRVMDELERNPSKYPATLKEVVAGNWFRGRDDLMRFEIDDSQSEILGNGVGDIVRMDEDDMDAYLRGFSFNVDNKFPDNSIQGMPEEQAFSTLGNILKHDQLYNQYPQLKNAPVIEDTAYFKRNPSVLGYFDDSSGTIAINTNKITTNEELRDTLLHEVQHLVQHLEGFESGTNVRNTDVLEIKKAIEGSPEYQKAFVDYNAKVSEYLENRDSATVAVYNKNKEVASKVLDIILDDFSNKTEIPVEEIYQRLNKGETFDQIKMSVSPNIRARGFVYSPEFEQILHIAEGNVGGMAPSSSIDLNRSLDDVNPRESAAPYFEMLSGKDKIDLIADNNRWQQNRLSMTIGSLVKDNPELAKDFENSLGFSAQDFIDAKWSQDGIGKLYGIPDVVPPTKPKIVRNYVIYSSKRGEVEARNVSARKGMAASERTPENVFDTEDTPASRQWGEPELKKARSGQNPVTGFANGPSASENFTPKDYKYVVSNPGGDWVKKKQELAEEASQRYGGGGKMLSGSITASLGSDFKNSSMFLDTKFLSTLRGAADENRRVGDRRFDSLKSKVDKSGFDPEQLDPDFPEYKEGNAIVIGVNHKGQAYILEGNTRVAVAAENNIPSVRAEVRYFNGAEDVDSPFSPENIIKHAEAPRQFAEGGAVGNMNQQMSFAFEDGGLRDDGMMRDPVSGNEVPSGSMASEVRDDIPAQLSEGEYVVPADVVRYYGVRFFEDLRDEAKRGLQDMESRGRIGGEPVPAGGPQAGGDLTPEEMAVLQELGMAEGGVVNMYREQQDLYSPPNPAIGNSMNMATGGAVPSYAPGGLQPAAQQTQNQIYAAGQQAQQAAFTGFPLGSTVFPTQAQIDQGQTTPAYYQQSEEEDITFQSIELINTKPPYDVVLATTEQMLRDYTDQGYVPNDGSFTPPVMGSDDGGPPTEPTGDSEPAFKDWATHVDWNSEESIRSFVNSIKKGDVDPITGKLAQGAGYMLAGIPGAIVGAALTDQGFLESVSNLRASQLLAEAKGFKDLSASIEKDIDSMLEGKSGITKFLANVFAKGTGRQTGVIETGRIDLTTPTTPKSTPPSEPKPSAARLAQIQRAKENDWSYDPDPKFYDKEPSGSLASTVSDASAAAGDSGQVSSTITNAGTAEQEISGGTQAEQEYVASAAAGNKGGLMNKAALKKKAKRQYKKGGLANKK